MELEVYRDNAIAMHYKECISRKAQFSISDMYMYSDNHLAFKKIFRCRLYFKGSQKSKLFLK